MTTRRPHYQRRHAILYSDDPEATRAALTRVLGTRSVDAGEFAAERDLVGGERTSA